MIVIAWRSILNIYRRSPSGKKPCFLDVFLILPCLGEPILVIFGQVLIIFGLFRSGFEVRRSAGAKFTTAAVRLSQYSEEHFHKAVFSPLEQAPDSRIFGVNQCVLRLFCQLEKNFAHCSRLGSHEFVIKTLQPREFYVPLFDRPGAFSLRAGGVWRLWSAWSPRAEPEAWPLFEEAR